jgi:hypothetical protein
MTPAIATIPADVALFVGMARVRRANTYNLLNVSVGVCHQLSECRPDELTFMKRHY